MDKELLKKKLDSLELFISTPAHSTYKATLAEGIATLEASILLRPPVTEEDRGAVLMLFGQREQAISDSKIFEDSRDELKAELDKLEAENPISTAV